MSICLTMWLASASLRAEMHLRNHLESLAAAERTAFADRCDTSLDYLWQIANGIRTPKVQLAVRISKESAGSVTCEELLPAVDWNYIRESLAPEERVG